MDNERIVIGRETDHVGRLHVSQEDILGRTIYLPPHSMRCFHVRRRLTTLSGELETGLYPPVHCRGVVGPSPVDDFHAAANGADPGSWFSSTWA